MTDASCLDARSEEELRLRRLDFAAGERIGQSNATVKKAAEQFSSSS
jgi:hypothetical protein